MAGFLNCADVADAGEDVLERAASGYVVMDVVGGEEGDANFFGNFVELFEAGEVVWAVEAAGGEGETVLHRFAEIFDLRFSILDFGRIEADGGKKTFVVFKKVFETERTFALF